MDVTLRQDGSSWHAQALCAQPGPLQGLATADVEEGIRGPLARAARDQLVIAALCARCPVREACLQDDLDSETPDRDFVRGGLTAAERDSLRNARTEVA